jgi:phosphoglycerate dehydrogenase-like enzyme
MESVMNVVIIGDFPEPSKHAIREMFPSEWTVAIGTLQDVAGDLAAAEVIIPEHASVDGLLLDRAPRLKLVQTGAGFDNVVIPECTRRGIVVAHAAGVNATAVAEHVIALVLCWYKNLVPLDRAMKRGDYSVAYAGAEIAGKTVGVIGMGHVGRAVARMAAALGMEVLPYPVHTVGGEDSGAARTDFTALLKRADVITVHCRLTDRTRRLIGSRELASMKARAFLVNTSRGGVVDEAALIEALKTGRIAGAGLDVYEHEPLPRDSPLRTLENVILTPHTGGMPDGLRFHRKRYLFFAENIRRVSGGQAPLNALNPL